MLKEYLFVIKMLLYALVTYCIATTTAYSVMDEYYDVLDDANQLFWEEAYSVQATRISLTSGVELDYSAWKTNSSSRIDYNHGFVKEISGFNGSNPFLYRIRLETMESSTNKTESYTNKLICRKMKVDVDSESYPTEFLPSELDMYTLVGDELLEGEETTHFKYIEQVVNEYASIDIVHSIWAISSNSTMSYDSKWIPVKYELSEYNKERGFLLKHEIWTYYNYESGVSDTGIFDHEQFGCKDKNAIKYSQEREKITKDLPNIDAKNEERVNHAFGVFKTKFSRNYAHENEHQLRKTIFRDNMRMITETNKKNLTYKLGINQFSDWTTEELEQSLGYLPELEEVKNVSPFLANESNLAKLAESLPKEYDMRILGLVSTVKNQDSCGSCWAFAAAAVTESFWARSKGGKLLSLSAQAIMDCAYWDPEYYSIGGCKLGTTSMAFAFIRRHGIPKDEEYGPYKSIEGYCNIANMTETYGIEDYKTIYYGSNNFMKIALVKYGALFAGIKVSKKFYAYSSGIFTEEPDHCDNNECANHAVAIVGYGERDGRLYWIIKNSWGTTWGMDGYILLDAERNSCHVNQSVSYTVA